MLLTTALIAAAVVFVVAGYFLFGRTKTTLPRKHPPSATSPRSDLYTDGPYVTYDDDSMVIYQVRIHDRKPTVVRNVMPFEERSTLTFSCQTDSKIPVSFKFTLHERITIPPTEYDLPERLLAVSDIEGNFYALQSLLVGNRVIDKDFNWIFGRGHLVLLGDFFDREINVIPCLWLIYKLEQEAAASGGQVHFILGNHEEMNLRGDERYLQEKYHRLADELNVPYHELLSNHTELGQWLRTKNAVEKIGDTLFVHGGISYLVEDSGLTLKEINRIVRRYIGLTEVEEEEGQLMLGNNGPLWYRGYFSESITERHITKVLETYEARQIVVGHTVVPEITTLYGGILYAIDVHQPTEANKGLAQCLWMERGKFFVANQEGLRRNVRSQRTLPTR